MDRKTQGEIGRLNDAVAELENKTDSHRGMLREDKQLIADLRISASSADAWRHKQQRTISEEFDRLSDVIIRIESCYEQVRLHRIRINFLLFMNAGTATVVAWLIYSI